MSESMLNYTGAARSVTLIGVLVNGFLTLLRIAKVVESHLAAEIENFSRVMIHVDPLNE